MLNMILYFNAETLILAFNHIASLNVEHRKQKEVAFYSSRGITILCTTCRRIGKIKNISLILLTLLEC